LEGAPAALVYPVVDAVITAPDCAALGAVYRSMDAFGGGSTSTARGMIGVERSSEFYFRLRRRIVLPLCLFAFRSSACPLT
jgi:hypothetical protein